MIHILTIEASHMSPLVWLFAPRKDHKGMSTPSYAARWWLLLSLAVVGYWSYQATDGNLYMWFALTMMVITPVLSLGWYIISIISARIPAEFILPKAEIAYNARMERKRLQSISQE